MFFLHPHKTFDKIFEEYGVMDKVTPGLLEKWGETVANIFLQTESDHERLELLVHESLKLGRRLGVVEERLPAFVEDIVRTSLFYLRFLVMVKRMQVQDP